MNDVTSDKIRVLLCEDEPLIMLALVDLLNDQGMETLEAGNGAQALAILSSTDVDVFVTDLGLPDISGLQLAVEARRLKPGLPIAFATGDTHVDGIEKVPGSVTLSKPCPDEELVGAIRHLARPNDSGSVT